MVLFDCRFWLDCWVVAKLLCLVLLVCGRLLDVVLQEEVFQDRVLLDVLLEHGVVGLTFLGRLLG